MQIVGAFFILFFICFATLAPSSGFMNSFLLKSSGKLETRSSNQAGKYKFRGNGFFLNGFPCFGLFLSLARVHYHGITHSCTGASTLKIHCGKGGGATDLLEV